MTKPIKIAFDQDVVTLPIEKLLPTKALPKTLQQSVKYSRIAASISEVGIIEPLSVARQKGGAYLLLDGHVRLAALREQEIGEAPCIIAHDDESFTYNKRVNRLATVQEHYMIQRALDRGVPAEMIAAALGIDAKLVQRRSKLLDGIAPEAVDILKDRPVNPQVFDTLRRMKPERQFATAELMASMNNFTATYAKAILAATRQEDLARPERPKKVKGVTPEQMARMERELESLNRDFRAVEATFGDDVLHLVLASRYIERVIANDAISSYIEGKHPEILAEFRNIVAAGTLDAAS